MSETNLQKSVFEGQARQRRNTYVIDKVSEDLPRSQSKPSDSLPSAANQNLTFNSSLHAGGIKALLDKANKGHDFVFPPEVKAYIVSHFRMIREENLKLNQSLEKANNQLNQVKAQNKENKEASEGLKVRKS